MLQANDGLALALLALPVVLAAAVAGLLLAQRSSVFELCCGVNAMAVACSEFSVLFRACILPSALLALWLWHAGRPVRWPARPGLHLYAPLAVLVGYLFVRGFPLGDAASTQAFTSLMVMFASALACCLLVGSVDRDTGRQLLRLYLVCGMVAIAAGSLLDAAGLGPPEEADLGHPVDAGFGLRLNAGFRHPNNLGFFALLELAVCLSLARAGVIGRRLAAFATLFTVATMLASGSRGVLVGLVACLATAAAVDRPLRRAMMRYVPGALAGGAALLLVLAILNPGDMVGYFVERYSGGGGSRQYASLDSRSMYWQLATAVFRAHPLFGSGTQMLPEAMADQWLPGSYYIFLAPDVLTPAHNVFLQYASSAGLVGLGLLLFWLGHFAVRSWRSVRAGGVALHADGMLGLTCVASIVSVGLTDVIFGPHWAANLVEAAVCGLVCRTADLPVAAGRPAGAVAGPGAPAVPGR